MENLLDIKNTTWEALPRFLKDCKIKEITDVNGNTFYALVVDELKSPSSLWVLSNNE